MQNKKRDFMPREKKDELEKEQFKSLVDFVSGMESNTLSVALKSLLTEREIASISQRLAIAKLANDGHTYKEIEKKLLVSPSTITKVIRNYREIENEFKALLERQESVKKQEPETILEEKADKAEIIIEAEKEIEEEKEDDEEVVENKEEAVATTFKEAPHHEIVIPDIHETGKSSKKPNIFSSDMKNNGSEKKKRSRKNFFSQLEDLIG